jgi:para-aminobenzoate synthetase component 1
VIATAAAALAPDEAARRAGREPGLFWLSGAGRDMVGAAPVRVVPGDGPADLDRLQQAWAEERASWEAGGSAAAFGIPAGVGWLSYDLGWSLAGLPPRAGDVEHRWPLVEFHFYDAVWVRAAAGEATIFAKDAAAAERLAARLARPAPARPAALGRLVPEHADAVFLDGVRRILEYLRAGDAYQVNLARRLSAACDAGGEAPVALAAALRARAPAPHAALIASADGAAWLLGNSPERFLALAGDGRVETRPIKGTRPRHADASADGAAAAALTASAKDRAEHVMIVDLERNDLGRVCRTGSVEVATLARLVSLPTVHHLESTVRGLLRPEVGLAALLAATFPGGSITGAPKRRAMQIIDELEPVRRGPYTGATGWLGVAGDLDLAVAIRTAAIRDGRLSLSVGGGIVADSNPDDELAETEVKARAFAALCDRDGGGDGR